MRATAFRVLLRMEVHPEAGPEFEQAWHGGAAVITDQPANLGQSLSTSPDEPNVYYIISDWLDEETFRAYETSDEHLEHRKRLHPYRARGSMTTMNVVTELTGAAGRRAA